MKDKEREELKVEKYRAVELDTGCSVEGYYYCENGYYMANGKPDINKPVKRHYIVDDDGRHREIAKTTLRNKQ